MRVGGAAAAVSVPLQVREPRFRRPVAVARLVFCDAAREQVRFCHLCDLVQQLSDLVQFRRELLDLRARRRLVRRVVGGLGRRQRVEGPGPVRFPRRQEAPRARASSRLQLWP